MAEIKGTDNDDVIRGGRGDDLIDGLDGNDRITDFANTRVTLGLLGDAVRFAEVNFGLAGVRSPPGLDLEAYIALPRHGIGRMVAYQDAGPRAVGVDQLEGSGIVGAQQGFAIGLCGMAGHGAVRFAKIFG